VLVGLGETAGYCSQLVEGFRAIGVRADHLDLGPDRHAYSERRARRAVRIVRALARRRSTGPGPLALWRTLHRLAMAYLFVEAVVRYDAFVLRAGDSFFAMRDLPLLRRLGKRLVVVFLGTDSRPTYMSGAEVARGIAGHEAARSTAAKRALVEKTERSATDVICHVMTAQLHGRPAIAFLQVGIPRRVPTAAARPPDVGDGRAIRVLHAPSNPAGKGTDEILAAVAEVRRRGIDLDLTVVTGRPNREVLDAIDACDFVVDELTSDTPMAGFAAEAAARGRPAVIGGYGWEELVRLTPGDVLPPSHLCHPDGLADALATLATDHAYRLELGRRAREFVAERWAPAAVARRMLAILSGDAPADWRFDPHDPVHPFGAGIRLEALAASISSVLDADGTAGLHVADKPELERRLVALARTGGER
jgi:hypothetical protein